MRHPVTSTFKTILDSSSSKKCTTHISTSSFRDLSRIPESTATFLQREDILTNRNSAPTRGFRKFYSLPAGDTTRSSRLEIHSGCSRVPFEESPAILCVLNLFSTQQSEDIRRSPTRGSRLLVMLYPRAAECAIAEEVGDSRISGCLDDDSLLGNRTDSDRFRGFVSRSVQEATIEAKNVEHF